MNDIPVGYTAICKILGISVIPHYRESYIARKGRGKIIIQNDHEIHLYPKSYSLTDEKSVLANLEFALKYDGVNLEIIKITFENLGKKKVTEYVQQQPTGIYSRKIWYLYEFLLKEQLELEDAQRIKYVDLLDSKMYFTSQAIKSPRHAINDNLLGNSSFCPFIRKTEVLEQFINLKLDQKTNELLSKYDPSLITRTCNYLYTKETLSSYQIERERPDKGRIARFVNLLQQAATIELISKEKLIELQNTIVDPRFKDKDYRQNQNYVGENVDFYHQKIHYISPKSEDLAELMQGLIDSLDRMMSANVHPVIIAAAISFGFVFIHPFEDGNGRIHRFLIHYILSKQNFTPKDIIFPVSSIMLQKERNYDMTLESFSKPLLLLLTDYDLSDDGVLTIKQDTKQYYQYIDLTKMAEFLFACIEEAIYKHIGNEIEFLVNYDHAKKSIQEILDIPDNQIDLFIKFVIQNHGSLSKQKQSRYFPLLNKKEIEQLTAIVRTTMLKNKTYQ